MELHSEQNVYICVCRAPSTVRSWGVAVNYHMVNEDSRICPVAIIHLNCVGDSEAGSSACIFPSGKDKSLQLNTFS